MTSSDARTLPRAPEADAAEPAASAYAAPLDHALVRQVITGIMLAMFLSALEQTIVAPALPTLGRVLGDVENLPFVVTAYLLAATAVTPLFGKLADIHGRRAVMLVSVAVFIVGSIACALAPSMGALIAGRALQGLGGGGILPIAQTIIADLLFEERQRWATSTIAGIGLLASLVPIITLAVDSGPARSMFDGAYVVDDFSLVLKALFCIAGYVVVLMSVNYVEEGGYYQGEYYTLLLSSILGMQMMASSRELVSMFVAL